MKNLKLLYNTISENQFGRLVLIAGTAGLFFIMAPILFGSITISIKMGIVSLLPFFVLSTISFVFSIAYSVIILPFLSQFTGWLLWAVFAKALKYTPLDGYFLDEEIERNPRKIIAKTKSYMHKILLCGGLAFYVHYNYALLVIQTFPNFTSTLAVGFLFGSMLGMQLKHSKNEDPAEHITSYFGKFIIGGFVGFNMVLSQIIIGFFIGHYMFELGYIGSLIAMCLNIAIVDTAYEFSEKAMLKIGSVIGDLIHRAQSSIQEYERDEVVNIV